MQVKTVHGAGASLLNFNRASVPLVEVVTEPDFRKASSLASAYMKELYVRVTESKVCRGQLQEGNFRCDANVLPFEKAMGPKEIWNKNRDKEFKFVSISRRSNRIRSQKANTPSGVRQKNCPRNSRLRTLTKKQTYTMRGQRRCS